MGYRQRSAGERYQPRPRMSALHRRLVDMTSPAPPRQDDRYEPESVSTKVEPDRPDPLQRRQSRSGALAEALQVNRQALRLQHTDACARNFGHGSDMGLRNDKGVSRQSPANPNTVQIRNTGVGWCR